MPPNPSKRNALSDFAHDDNDDNRSAPPTPRPLRKRALSPAGDTINPQSSLKPLSRTNAQDRALAPESGPAISKVRRRESLPHSVVPYTPPTLFPKKSLKSPSERGLCQTCGQFNWSYHLTQAIPNPVRDIVSFAEGSVINQILHSNPQPDDDNGILITGTPYSGTYHMHKDKLWITIRLSTFHSMFRNRLHCSLCGLVVRAVQSSTSREDMDYLLSVSKIISCSIYPGDEDPLHVYLETNTDIHTEDSKFNWQFSYLGDRRHLWTRQILNPHQIEVTMIRDWWHDCVHDHGISCSPLIGHVLGPEVAEHFKIVDVCMNRVIAAPSGCRYIALSYVWGDMGAFKVTRGDFKEQTYIELDRNRLPRTIRDAMFATEMLGERYLWVDSLCIVQDNPEELEMMINSMDRVFNAAILTIIAAAGDNAYSGLPGIFPGSRYVQPVTGYVDSVSLVGAEPSLCLEDSRWGKRGWTYQEYQLSARALIFTNDRVFYECRRGLWGEGRPKKPTTVGLKTQFLDFSGKFSHLGTTSAAFLKYSEHVTQYMKRDLTYEGDILNAFTAILQDQTNGQGITFCWGLPTNKFTAALMWVNGPRYSEVCSPPLKRRVAQHSSKHQFPSWSWTGWIGKISFDHYHGPSYFVQDLQECVTWPWEREYDVPDADDVFETGYLSVRVDIAVLDHQQVPPTLANFVYFRYDNGASRSSGTTECILLGRISENFKHILNDHILLAVTRGHNNIYYRLGLFRVSHEFWLSLQRTKKLIRLG
jgi:hypothetical protein